MPLAKVLLLLQFGKYPHPHPAGVIPDPCRTPSPHRPGSPQRWPTRKPLPAAPPRPGSPHSKKQTPSQPKIPAIPRLRLSRKYCPAPFREHRDSCSRPSPLPESLHPKRADDLRQKEPIPATPRSPPVRTRTLLFKNGQPLSPGCPHLPLLPSSFQRISLPLRVAPRVLLNRASTGASYGPLRAHP